MHCFVSPSQSPERGLGRVKCLTDPSGDSDFLTHGPSSPSIISIILSSANDSYSPFCGLSYFIFFIQGINTASSFNLPRSSFMPRCLSFFTRSSRLSLTLLSWWLFCIIPPRTVLLLINFSVNIWWCRSENRFGYMKPSWWWFFYCLNSKPSSPMVEDFNKFMFFFRPVSQVYWFRSWKWLPSSDIELL